MTREEAIKEAKIQIDVYENMILYCKYFEPKEDTSKYKYKIEFLKIAIEALERQTHSCKNCLYADYMAETNRIYCLAHGCVMTLDNYCRDWSDEDDI